MSPSHSAATPETDAAKRAHYETHDYVTEQTDDCVPAHVAADLEARLRAAEKERDEAKEDRDATYAAFAKCRDLLFQIKQLAKGPV